MSGLMKNLDKIVSSQIMSIPNRLILSNRTMRFNQASIFYEPSNRITGLQQGHPFDCYALSTISQALTYESQQFAGYLDGDKNEEVKAEIELNQRLVKQCLSQAQIMIKAGRWSQETDASANIIYAIEQSKRIQKRLAINDDSQFDSSSSLYKEYICPSILRNLKYLSHLNIVDITEGLVYAGYNDIEFWNKFLNHIEENSTFQQSFQPVDFHAWSTNEYEFKQPKSKSLLPKSSTQVQLQYFSGNQNAIAALQRIAQQLYLEAKIGFWLPVFQKEGRIKYIFNERDPLSHREDFKSALKQLSESVIETKASVQRLLQIA